MSLLLEALKKAERDKLALDPAQRAAEQSGLSSLSEASAEETLPGYPPPSDSPSAASRPVSPAAGSTLELMQKEPAPSRQHSDDSARQQSAQEPSRERAAAQNVFAAKQGSSAGIMGAGRAGKGLIIAGVAVFVIIGGGAYYVWQEITRAPGIGVVSGPAPVSVPSAPAPLPAPVPMASIPQQAAPPAPPAASDASPLHQAERMERTEGSRGAEEENVTMPAPVRARVESPGEPAIRLQRKQSANEIPPLLTAAYQAYLAGDLMGARQKYLQLLQHDPRNKDVLLGLAAIAVHLQQPGEAQAYYLRVLEADPQNASAIAGMTGLGQQLNPSQAQTESRLKTLLAQQPDAAALHFTLGNHYASQLRWGEAQQVFFRALSIDANNAEYAFNLAVSLDHLNQNKLAAEYYNKALALTGAAPAGFDKAQAVMRLKELAR